eukprot:3744842-Rhodomonas_salina.1
MPGSVFEYEEEYVCPEYGTSKTPPVSSRKLPSTHVQLSGQLRPGSETRPAGQSFLTPPQHHELAGQRVQLSMPDS